MNRKLLVISISAVLMLITITFSSAVSINTTNVEIGKEIFNEIKVTKDKLLVVDKIIGDRYVKFWEHVIDDVSVKNDSILLHLDPETGDILEYNKIWTDVELYMIGSGENILPTKEYHWKKAVVFPDENDSGIYCNFHVPVEYPLTCWEVRYTDGTTIFYDSSGIKIGDAVPAPSKGCTLRGWGDSRWSSWRNNANEWYGKWCSRLYIADEPTVGQISSYISKPDVEYFYVIAHSGHQNNRFSANDEGVYYYADQLKQDMIGRSPMNLSVLCCCSAMEGTGPGSLSYEFRKGEMEGTVTIGYYKMGECGAWPWESKSWQNAMFEAMDDYTNYTMKEAFDLACAFYPNISGHVRFVGDEALRIEIDDHIDLTGQCYYGLLENHIKIPIKNVKVKCEAEDPNTYDKTTYTDSDGYYEFANIPRFTNITVSASKFCHQPKSPNPTTFEIKTPRNLNFKLSIFKSTVSQSGQQQSSGVQQFSNPFFLQILQRLANIR